MLEGVKPEVSELGDLFTRSPDAEDAASVLGAFLAGEQIMIESTVTTWHATECRRDRPLVRIGDTDEAGVVGGLWHLPDGVEQGFSRQGGKRPGKDPVGKCDGGRAGPGRNPAESHLP